VLSLAQSFRGLALIVKDSLWKNIDKNKNDYFIIDRFTEKSISLSTDELSDLITLTLANWLEQRPGAPEEYKYIRKQEFINSKNYLPQIAYAEFKEAYGIH